MFNLYIDESCHLEHDGMPVMCIGYTKIDAENYSAIKEQIKHLKLQYKNPTEIKWNNVSASRLSLYKALIDYFLKRKYTFVAFL